MYIILVEILMMSIVTSYFGLEGIQTFPGYCQPSAGSTSKQKDFFNFVKIKG